LYEHIIFCLSNICQWIWVSSASWPLWNNPAMNMAFHISPQDPVFSFFRYIALCLDVYSKILCDGSLLPRMEALGDDMEPLGGEA
jgi:hypothetical protein